MLLAFIARSFDSLKHFKLLSMSSIVLFSKYKVSWPILEALENSVSTLKKKNKKKLKVAFYIGSTPTFLYFDLFLNTASYTAHHVHNMISHINIPRW